MTDYKEKFEKMRIAGRLAANTLDMLTENIKKVFQQTLQINLDMNLLETMAVIQRHYITGALQNLFAHL